MNNKLGRVLSISLALIAVASLFVVIFLSTRKSSSSKSLPLVAPGTNLAMHSQSIYTRVHDSITSTTGLDEFAISLASNLQSMNLYPTQTLDSGKSRAYSIAAFRYLDSTEIECFVLCHVPSMEPIYAVSQAGVETTQISSLPSSSLHHPDVPEIGKIKSALFKHLAEEQSDKLLSSDEDITVWGIYRMEGSGKE